jgi:hypothetical protein
VRAGWRGRCEWSDAVGARRLTLVGASPPPYHASEQSDDDRQTEPALSGVDVGDDPRHVWALGFRMQKVRNQDRRLTHPPASGAISGQRAQMAKRAHQSRNAMLTAGLSGFTQIEKTRGVP